ncbi:hypothetical protein QR46_2776 [Giardia duodenalis assemblage B]|uniref:Uncharacterized protein n=1 Tax=Giardia duodenalis assemblage B TaxID=1394984 RepID=A0A132NT84_GIAIN|nr:hypothetical protein QR46_2776 [Giardia intestinalis assemblage B]
MSNYLQTIQYASTHCKKTLANSDYGKYLLSQARLYEQLDNAITFLQIPPSASPAAVAAILPNITDEFKSETLAQPQRQVPKASGSDKQGASIDAFPNETALYGGPVSGPTSQFSATKRH